MQPENSRSGAPRPEQLPMPPAMNPEMVPHLPPLDTRFEQQGQGGAERIEQMGEARAQAANMVGASYAAPVAAPVGMPQVQGQAPVPVSATPLVAADEELIEKEWVDKAKEIIEQTSDDPYTRTEKVNELQRDYLKKRYNRVIGASDNGV